MKLNQKLIEQLRNGEIAVENNGTVEQLREVLKEAFPKDNTVPRGLDKYYYSDDVNIKNKWFSTNYPQSSVKEVLDFYQPELFTGWAKDDNHPKWMFYFKDDMGEFGLNDGGEWMVNPGNRYSSDKDNRPATHKEIEKALIKEAKRRGYKGGDTIKGLHRTTHKQPKICWFYYDAEHDRLLTYQGCVVYEKGQWAEIIEQPSQVKPKDKTNPIHYTVEGITYSLNYQELKTKYESVVNYSDEQFMEELPKIAHLACIISYFKGLGTQATISDKGIIHELIHLMTDPDEPTNDLQEIREKFNKLIQLV